MFGSIGKQSGESAQSALKNPRSRSFGHPKSTPVVPINILGLYGLNFIEQHSETVMV